MTPMEYACAVGALCALAALLTMTDVMRALWRRVRGKRKTFTYRQLMDEADQSHAWREGFRVRNQRGGR